MLQKFTRCLSLGTKHAKQCAVKWIEKKYATPGIMREETEMCSYENLQK